MNKKIVIFIISFCLILFSFTLFPTKIYAGCGDAKPGTPTLLSAIPGDQKVTLVWSEGQGPLSYYLLRYGLSKENLEYGNTDIGGPGATSFTVDHLTNGTRYYFQVRAGNGCKPGSFSHTLSAAAGVAGSTAKGQPRINLSMHKQVLGASTSITPTKKPQEKKKPSPSPVPITSTSSCGFTCVGGPLLGIEILLLAAYFYLAGKTSFMKPLISVLIPVATIVWFYRSQGACNSHNFFCSFFLPLTIIIFMIFFVVHKYTLTHRHINYQTM